MAERAGTPVAPGGFGRVLSVLLLLAAIGSTALAVVLGVVGIQFRNAKPELRHLVVSLAVACAMIATVPTIAFARRTSGKAWMALLLFGALTMAALVLLVLLVWASQFSPG